MNEGTVEIAEALDRLEAAAATVEAGWLPSTWTQRAEDGTELELSMGVESYHLRQVGVFEHFALAADRGVELDVDLDLPAALHGVPLAGEPLQLIVNSLRPVDIRVDGARVFGDRLPIVALGPALIDVVPALRAGHNGRLTLHVLPTPVALEGDWGRTGITAQFTTPALRERWRVLDLAHARLLLAQAFSDSPERVEATVRAARRVPHDLETPPTPKLEEVLGEAIAADLGWLDEALADYRIHCIGHSHLDLAWLWTYDDTREVLARDMRSVLDLLDDYPEFRFTHSQARSYAELEQSQPELFARAIERIRDGRLEPATTQWVEADVNLPGGPAQARQFVEGVAFSRRQLGVEPRVLLAPDTFGHSGSLPQLARQAGAEVYYHHRANPGFPADGRYWQAYWWVGDDGSRILAVATPLYLGPVTASRLALDLVALGKGNGVTEVCFFYGVGDHGGGPTRVDLELIRELSSAGAFPAVRCSTVSEYANALLASQPALPEHHGESEHVFEGTYISHADSKHLNRACENELVAAGTLAALAGVDATADLSAAWRGVLHHQFHDILGGSAVAGAYRDQERDARSARSFAAELSGRSLDVLLAGAPKGSIAVSNVLGTERADVVVVPRATVGDRGGLVDDSGTPVVTQRSSEGDLVFVADVDAFGHRGYRVDPASRSEAPDIRVTPLLDGAAFLVETRFFRAELRADSGIVTSLIATDSGRVLVGRNPSSPEGARQHRAELGLGALVLGHERQHPMSSWVQDELDSERTLLGTCTTTIAELGPVRVVFESAHEFGSSRAVVRTIVYAALPWLDYEIAVDWNEPGSPQLGVPSLAVSFASRLPAHDFWTEAPFSAVRREPDGFLAPMLRWADLGSAEGGLLVANDGKYGADALGPRLRIPLVRSAYDPDPASDRGRLDSSRFRVYPHAGRWQGTDAVTIAAGLNLPLRVSSPHGDRVAVAGIRPHLVDSGSVRIAGLDPVDGAIEARLYESAGEARTATLSGLPPHSTVTECTIVGDPVAEHRADASGAVRLEFGAFQVRTLRFPHPNGPSR